MKHQPDGFVDSDKSDISAVKKALKAIHWSLNSDPRTAAKEDYQSIVNYCSANPSRHILEDLTVEAEYNCWLEKVEFQARNAFNAVVTETASVWVKSTNGHENVLDVQMTGE